MMNSTKPTTPLPTIPELPTMDDSKTTQTGYPTTPPRSTSARQDTPIPKTPTNAPCLLRTAPAKVQESPDDDEDDRDALFSKERLNESPTLRKNRLLLKATHTDPRYLDRPIMRPSGPRPVPQAPQRLKRHRHSEPVTMAMGHEAGGLSEKAPLVGPRPLVENPSVLDDPCVGLPASRRSSDSAPRRSVMEADDDNDTTPKASRLNKRRRAVSREEEEEEEEDDDDDDDIYD